MSLMFGPYILPVFHLLMWQPMHLFMSLSFLNITHFSPAALLNTQCLTYFSLVTRIGKDMDANVFLPSVLMS